MQHPPEDKYNLWSLKQCEKWYQYLNKPLNTSYYANEYGVFHVTFT